MKNANIIITLTEKVKNKINQNENIPKEKIYVFPSGGNISLFKPLDKIECRKILNLDVNKKYIGFVGNFYKYQGVDVLIESAKFVVKEMPQVMFLIIGDGEMKNEWMRKVNDYGLDKYFIFTGIIPYEKMPVAIGSMDICIAPFTKDAGERSPVKVFDYLACGKPVIAGDIDCLKDIFKENEILFFPVENYEKLAESIIYLLKNEDIAKKLGENARKICEEKFDRENIAKKIVNIFIYLNSNTPSSPSL
jgi:glycosyltransferase involved in cell wall biosynthesis